MNGSGRKGKSLINNDQLGVTTRSRTKQLTQSKYCDGNCVKSPETSRKELDPTYLYKTVDQSGEINHDLVNQENILETMAVEKQLEEIRDLLAKRHDQLGDTLIGMQAALEKVPTDSSHISEAKLEKFPGYKSQDSDLEWRLQQNLSSRKQGENKSLDSYVDFVSSTCQRLGVSEKDKMHYFVQGLREDIKRDVLMQKLGTYNEAKSVARLKVSVERTLKDGRAFNQSTDPEKAVLYKMLEKLMPVQKDSRTELTPKVAAFSSQEGNDFAAELRKLRMELSREFHDELQALKTSINQNQRPQNNPFPPRNNNSGFPRDNPRGEIIFKGGR